MTKRYGVLAAATALLGLLLARGAWAQTESAPPPGKSEGMRSATVVTVTGKIVKVDKAARTVTVEGPEGRTVALRVDNPYNLKSAKVGDLVLARFYEVVTVRKKKPGETLPSASLKAGIATAQPGGTPGAVASQHMSLVVSVTGIDKDKGTVTIKGPDGSVETVEARNRKNLDRIQVGDELVVTLSRAVAITLEKPPAT